ncbi:MAG: hypothetical protein IPO27_05115 [Bacteroidetes bacterium]|nr:hypothetical protein [Bacteroidota bacterium]
MQQYYVAGNSSAWFLIGDNVDYYPISLTVDATVGGGVRASAIAGDDVSIITSNIDAAKSVNRHWKIDSAGVELSGLSVTLNWQPADIDAGADWNLFEVSKLHDGIWTPLTVTNRTATSITASYTGNQLSTFQVGQPVCIINIPDANFKNALLANALINTNSDSEIQCAEAAAYTGHMYINGLGIADLTGIEAFTALDGLTCYDNSLSTLDLSANTQLTYLFCANNLLTSLDLSNNLLLQTLLCGGNPITNLDLSANTAITFFNSPGMSVTNLDLSAQTGLTWLNVSNTPSLSSLNVQNGNNSNLTFFNASSNPLLTCIQVDDIAYMNTNWSGGKDAGAIYSTNCACIVNIPDANFKSALVSDFSINTNEDGEIQCAEAIAYTGTINVNSLGISDLTGIEAFTNLTGLDCSTNNLTALDISYNTFLQTINCAVNSITNLAFTGNTAFNN